MAQNFLDLALTPAVLAAQEHAYGRAAVPGQPGDRDALGPEEVAFVTARDSFYMATVSETGWPYVQHRGGPPGFVKVLGPNEIAFADLRGNRQLISTGNLAGNDRVALILVDYPRRARLKILGHARAVDRGVDPELDARFDVDRPGGRVERILRIDVVAFDWNCPQNITPRWTKSEVEAVVAPLRARIAELEGLSRG
ncbi:MAG: pyridoxamine 5'-phosphate oxidase family protein [Planctomycetota bacterium]|nr:pyridoxamine 5'-phosphate oxidase family protein [Planctomycetota bacterium]